MALLGPQSPQNRSGKHTQGIQFTQVKIQKETNKKNNQIIIFSIPIFLSKLHQKGEKYRAVEGSGNGYLNPGNKVCGGVLEHSRYA